MKQPQWDKYEAAFLLEYCLKVENNELSRKEAITTVSEHLRERAKDRGFEIDEVFRNENGISMQMSAMRNCYLEKNKGLTISKLFKEVVALYKTNRNIFEKIIQEESSKVNKTIYQEFLLWLKTEKPNDTKEVIEYLSMLSMFVIKRKQLHKPIADITDADEIEHLQSIMNKPETLGIHSKKMSAKIDKALKMYLHFLHSKDKKDLSCLNCKSVLIEEKQSEDYFKVDFSSSQNYAHTKPVSCRYKGRNIPCSGWNSVFINITRAIYQDCHTKFPVGHSLSSSSRIDIGSPEGMVYPKEIANGIYLECNVSASGVVSKLRALMVICGMNYSDVVIEYRQNVKQSKVQKKTETAVIPSTQLQWMPHFTKELTELIAKYYKYGFRVGSPIELMRLRNYAESANVELPVSDEELEREVSVVGVLIDGKIYALSDEILEEVASITDIIFEQGVGVIFIELFMEKNSEWLEEHYIVTVDMLKEILKKARPQYYLGQNIITVAEKISEHDAIVKEILRVSKGSSVVIFSELVEVLEYIPSEKIAWSLSMSPEFVWISEGKYFGMKDFIISEEDENAISMYVDRECGLNGYVSITNLPYGNIPEENYELSDSALQTAVYNKVLKKNYYLHGKILTKESNGVDIDILLKAYCSGKDICTASEVMERAIELTGNPNKQNVMAALYDTMIRIGADKFISEQQVHFDVERIDELLTQIVSDRFIPIRGVTTFALFPPCGTSWNHYLLESFCYRFSKKFRLVVMNYNDKNAGLIKAFELSLNYTDMLCEAAAKSNEDLTVEAVGNYFFNNGFTAKRKYSNLPEIIERAKITREEG